MNRKKLARNMIVLILLLLAAALIIFFRVSYLARYKYTKDCFYSNKDEFESLLKCFDDLYSEGITYAEYEEGTDCFSVDYGGDDVFLNTAADDSDLYNDVKAILTRLREQYQKDSDYPVFSSVEVQYDDNGDMLLSVQAKKKKLKNCDGVDTPDIIVYSLVYIDENYDENSPIKEEEAFYGNWYTWSHDTYSG